jgi:hypothetical protein
MDNGQWTMKMLDASPLGFVFIAHCPLPIVH